MSTILAPRDFEGSVVWKRALLASGFVSSLVYIATDIAGGMSYDGYSFASQAVSELMARGAPSEPLVDPLFMLYNAFVLAFGLGLVLARSDRAAQWVGMLLVVYGVLGFTGPTLFEMNQRGTDSVAGDTPHIALTAIIALLLLLAIGTGAFALGKRFRVFSFSALLVMIVAGVLTVPFGARIAAGEPTPGFGILERVCIYAGLAWVAAYSLAQFRRMGRPGARSAKR